MFLRRLATFCLIAAVSLVAVAAAEDADDVDYVDLASLLVQDGHYDRAEAALLNIADPNAEGVDTPRYHTVDGLIHLNRNELADARDAFLKAIDAGLVDELTGEAPELIHIYLSQCHFGLEDYRAAIASLDDAGQTAERISSTWTMRAHSHWLLGEKQRSFDVLESAQERFPVNLSFMRRKVFYLVELGLYLEAGRLGRVYLKRSEGSVEDYIAIGNALHRAGDSERALVFLEEARLRYPNQQMVMRVLAHVYLESGQRLAAAEILYQGSLLNPELTSEAAEVFRRAGKLQRALMLNGQIQDQKRKFQQRLAIFLELGDYEQIAAMEGALIRTGVLEQEDLRYALAYAWFKIGEFARAEEHLGRLRAPDLFQKATELRRAMEDCQSEPWLCS